MTVKNAIKRTLWRVGSIFKGKRIPKVAKDENCKIDAMMKVEKLARDHWKYVEGVLLRHGVHCQQVWYIGVAYRCGFVAGWMSYTPNGGEVWELWSTEHRPGCPAVCKPHFIEAFIHGCKHRNEEEKRVN